jgi:ElaB/YqjD/DUF883 family membrane-anchored ribosome-binding protein
MATDTLEHTADDAKAATRAATKAGEKALNDALASAERTITEAAKTAERLLKEGVETLRAQTKAYSETAGQQVDEAQKYVLERVKERPLTATLAGLGVGVLLGLLLSNRTK